MPKGEPTTRHGFSTTRTSRQGDPRTGPQMMTLEEREERDAALKRHALTATAANALIYAGGAYYLGRNPLLAAAIGAALVYVARRQDIDAPGAWAATWASCWTPGDTVANWITP